MIRRVFAVAVVASIALVALTNPAVALLWIADAWSCVHPPQIEATTAAISDRTDLPTDAERSLLAECVHLRAELAKLQPTSLPTNRLVRIHPVAGQVLWTPSDGRDAFLSLVEASTSDENALVVADTAIDLGASQGVEPDGLVLAGRRLIGRVSRVGIRSCGVIPTTSSEFQISADIVRRANATTFVGSSGTYRGDDDVGGILDFVPADRPVSVGDEVFTSANSLWSGERLHVGTVAQAELFPGEPHWRIVVAPSGAVRSRDHVLVLRPRANLLEPEPSTSEMPTEADDLRVTGGRS